jgi:hypothetical protein
VHSGEPPFETRGCLVTQILLDADPVGGNAGK